MVVSCECLKDFIGVRIPIVIPVRFNSPLSFYLCLGCQEVGVLM